MNNMLRTEGKINIVVFGLRLHRFLASGILLVLLLFVQTK